MTKTAINWLASYLLERVCNNIRKKEIHEGGHGPVFVSENPLGTWPIPMPNFGASTIEAPQCQGVCSLALSIDPHSRYATCATH